MVQPVRREVHFWSTELVQPPCETVEDGFEGSDAVEDVTCEGCLEALAGDAGDLAPARDRPRPGDGHPVP